MEEQVEPNISQTAEQSLTPVEQGEATQQPNSDNLLQRVSEFMSDKAPESEAQIENKQGEFNQNDIDAIQDPQAKEYAQKAYKSLQGDFTKKFQELSALRKEFEQARENKNWTPERVQSLLSDQEFVSAAQQVAGEPAKNDDYSVLSESEQAKINKITELENEMNTLKQQSQLTIRSQETERLKGKYPNYNSDAMDTITKEFLDKKRVFNLEDIWKSYNHDNAVEAAYKMGLTDKNAGNIEKTQAMSGPGNTVVGGNVQPERGENESNRNFAKKSFASSASKVLGSLVHGNK